MLTIQEISSLAILIPLFIAAIKLKTGEVKLSLFFLFLLFGAISDGLGFLANNTNQLYNTHFYILTLYLFYEALFFLWLSSYNYEAKFRGRTRAFFSLVFLLSFAANLYIVWVDKTIVFYSMFSTFTLIITSFLTGYGLLRMSEKVEGLITFPWFWILSGVFIYSFGTFFIDTLSYTKIVDPMWRLRNIINIVQYMFFFTGLILIKKKEG